MYSQKSVRAESTTNERYHVQSEHMLFALLKTACDNANLLIFQGLGSIFKMRLFWPGNLFHLVFFYRYHTCLVTYGYNLYFTSFFEWFGPRG